MRKMTAAEYLSERGWLGGPDTWARPEWNIIEPNATYQHGKETMPTEVAVRVQKARDAAEERAAWVQESTAVGVAMAVQGVKMAFGEWKVCPVCGEEIPVDSKGLLMPHKKAGEVENCAGTGQAPKMSVKTASIADALLDTYREKFAVEITDAPEATK